MLSHAWTPLNHPRGGFFQRWRRPLLWTCAGLVCLTVVIIAVVIFSNSLNDKSAAPKPESNPIAEGITSWSRIKTRPRTIDPINLSEKWVVLTTKHDSPSSHVRDLAAVGRSTGWKMVIVSQNPSLKADNSSEWTRFCDGMSNLSDQSMRQQALMRTPLCVFLDTRKQQQLDYQISRFIPPTHTAIKNIGYLYAIEHGAQMIYDTNEAIIINEPVIEHLFVGFSASATRKPQSPLLLETDNPWVQPFAHFGKRLAWPRGYPFNMNDSKFVHHPSLYASTSSSATVAFHPLIQHQIVNGEPDTAAAYRLIRESKRIHFDSNAPPLGLHPGTLAPFNDGNTLFLRDALFTAMLPAEVSSRSSDIIRSYWAQRLLWCVGGNLLFAPPGGSFSFKEDRDKEGANILQDVIEELRLINKSAQIAKLLLQWNTAEDSQTTFGRTLDLSSILYRNGIMGKDDVFLTLAWLSDLLRIGYTPPLPRNIYPRNPPRTDPNMLVKYVPQTLPDTMDIADLKLVWDIGAEQGCTGFALEVIYFIVALQKYIPNIALIAGPLCEGLPDDILSVLKIMKSQPHASWDVDIFVSHKSPSMYPTWPNGDMKKKPRYIVGRSMFETDIIPRGWKSTLGRVDEIWVPARFLVDSFVRGGVAKEKIHIIPEAINTDLYDLTADPLPLPGSKKFKFFSVFKWEQRKGVDALLSAFMEEFGPNDDVALYMLTRLFEF